MENRDLDALIEEALVAGSNEPLKHPLGTGLEWFVLSTPILQNALKPFLRARRIFPSADLETVDKTIRLVHQRKYSDAFDELNALVDNPRSYRTLVPLGVLISDIYFQAGLLVDEVPNLFDLYMAVLQLPQDIKNRRPDLALKLSFRQLNEALSRPRNIVQNSAEPYESIISGMHAFAEGRQQKAKLLFDAAVRGAPYHALAHAFRMSFYRGFGSQHAADLELRVCAELAVNSPHIQLIILEGSRHGVFLYGVLAMKSSSDAQELEDERVVIERFHKKFGSVVPLPLPVYKRGETYWLVLERSQTTTFLELLQKQSVNFDDFAEALHLLAGIQHFGHELYRSGELALDDSILRFDLTDPETHYFANRRLAAAKQLERFNAITLPESYLKALRHPFVDKAIASSSLLTMYKDYNPKNLLRNKYGPMNVLDFEPSSLRLLPPQFDLVNFIEFTDYLPEEQKRQLIEVFARAYQKENQITVDRNEFGRVLEFVAFQWHYERLMYRPGEESTARTLEQRDEKREDQVRYLLRAKEHLDTIIARRYVSGDDLTAANRLRKELDYPIFLSSERQRQFEDIVRHPAGRLAIALP